MRFIQTLLVVWIGLATAQAADPWPPSLRNLTVWEGTYPPETLDENLAEPGTFVAVGASLMLGLILFVAVSSMMRGRRPRFSLRVALAFMIAAGIFLFGGVPMWSTDRASDHVAWKRKVRQSLNTPVYAGIDDMTLPQAARSIQTQSRIFIVVSPSLANEPIKTPLEFDHVRLSDALDKLCERVKAKWSVCNGAIFIYPENVLPPQQRVPHADEPWQLNVETSIQRRVSLEFFDMPFDEGVNFISEISGVEIRISPDLREATPVIQFCPVSEMRVDDALTWMCLLADAQWSLRKGPDGKGEIYISPREREK